MQLVYGASILKLDMAISEEIVWMLHAEKMKLNWIAGFNL